MPFPSGFYWYGTKRSKSGQPHKKVLKQLVNMEVEMKKLFPEATPGLDETEGTLMEKPVTKKDKSPLETSQKTSISDSVIPPVSNVPPVKTGSQQLNDIKTKAYPYALRSKKYRNAWDELIPTRRMM